MAIADLVKKIVGEQGFDARTDKGWKTRLRESISFISPKGDTFEAKWEGDSRTIEKKLGIWEYAKVKGTLVQDLGNKSTRYPLNFMFAGHENDTESERFFKACSQTGQWEITHPTKGFLGLTLSSATEKIQPVSEGGLTRFETEWIEDIDKVNLKTTAQLAAESGNKLNEFNSVAASQFADKVKVESISERLAISDTVGKIQTSIDTILGPIAAANDEIYNTWNAVQRGVQDVLEAAILDPLSLASQIQQLTQLPAYAIRDVKSRLNAYRNLAAEVAGIDNSEEKGTNVSSVMELQSMATFGAMSVVSVTGISPLDLYDLGESLTSGDSSTTTTIQTKADVIATIESISEDFIFIVDSLDAEYVKTKTDDIDEQFFSMTESFGDAYYLINLGLRYLLDNFYNLRIEKRFVLDAPSSAIKLTIENYGSMGENDSLYNLFVASNNLTGSELILLPIGKEVVVYA